MKINVYVLTEFTGCCGVEVLFVGDSFGLEEYLNKYDKDYTIENGEYKFRDIYLEVDIYEIELRG